MTPKLIKEKFMKNSNTNKLKIPVDVVALFTYGLNPCEPLRFRRQGSPEQKVTGLLSSKVRFVGENALHIFNVLVGSSKYELEFNSESLHWSLTEI